jgi:hypothetical protein
LICAHGVSPHRFSLPSPPVVVVYKKQQQP